ncbi:MAG: hypothetical protein RIC14_00190 [Filomicrobium sp.]
MHFRGFVIVDQPTNEAVNAAMEPHREGYDSETDTGYGEWDWFRVGGRYDGYLVSDGEMLRRETKGGFNFGPAHTDIARNSVKVSDLPKDRRSIYFFVVGKEWVAKESWDGETFKDNEDFEGQLSEALKQHPDKYVVVVDAHS